MDTSSYSQFRVSRLLHELCAACFLPKKLASNDRDALVSLRKMTSAGGAERNLQHALIEAGDDRFISRQSRDLAQPAEVISRKKTTSARPDSAPLRDKAAWADGALPDAPGKTIRAVCTERVSARQDSRRSRPATACNRRPVRRRRPTRTQFSFSTSRAASVAATSASCTGALA